MKLRYIVSGLIMASLLLGACQPEVVEVIKEVPVEKIVEVEVPVNEGEIWIDSFTILLIFYF